MITAFDGSPITPLPLVIDYATSGNKTVITPDAGLVVRVYSLRLTVAGAVIVQVLDQSTILEVINFGAAGDSFVLPLRKQPYYTTTGTNNFRLNLSGAVQINGVLEYATAK